MRYPGMTLNANRVFVAALVGAVLAVAAILFAGDGSSAPGDDVTATSAQYADTVAKRNFVRAVQNDVPSLAARSEGMLLDLGDVSCRAQAQGTYYDAVAAVQQQGYDFDDARNIQHAADASLCG